MNDSGKNLYSKEGYKLMAAAFEVHNEQGGGLLEEIYQECLEIELESRELPFTPRQELAIFYKGRELRKRYIPDLILFGEVVVELKALSALAPEHDAQLLNYMRISKKPVGYLINFGPMDEVEWKRFVL